MLAQLEFRIGIVHLIVREFNEIKDKPQREGGGRERRKKKNVRNEVEKSIAKYSAAAQLFKIKY